MRFQIAASHISLPSWQALFRRHKLFQTNHQKQHDIGETSSLCANFEPMQYFQRAMGRHQHIGHAEILAAILGFYHQLKKDEAEGRR